MRPVIFSSHPRQRTTEDSELLLVYVRVYNILSRALNEVPSSRSGNGGGTGAIEHNQGGSDVGKRRARTGTTMTTSTTSSNDWLRGLEAAVTAAPRSDFRVQMCHGCAACTMSDNDKDKGRRFFLGQRASV